MENADSSQALLSFFGLRRQPFAATVDPVYFYATREHKECLFRLWNSIDERHGAAVVLGHYGTGKTTLLRKVLTGMRAKPDRYNVAVIGSPVPSWTSFSLLEGIVTQFGLKPETRSFDAYMETLHRHLLKHPTRINTLIIDDAQHLNKRDQLELLRLVQDLETPRHTLLNLVCFSQMEWLTALRAAPDFAQRVHMSCTLGPLDLAETRGLIDFRLRQAGAAGGLAPVFDDGAVKTIHAYAQGSPRETVTLCRNALFLAAQIRTRQLGQDVILHTIQRTTLPDTERRSRVSAALEESPQTAAPDAPPEPASAPRPAPPRAHSVLQRRANDVLLNTEDTRRSIVKPEP